MRILLVNYEYPPLGGGAATASQAIARGLARLGHTVVVLTGGFAGLPRSEEENGVSVRRLRTFRRSVDHSDVPEMGLFLVRALISAPLLVRRHRIDAAIIFFAL